MSTPFFQNTDTKNSYFYQTLLLNNDIINRIITEKVLYNKILFTYNQKQYKKNFLKQLLTK